jgi:hypothetical protein
MTRVVNGVRELDLTNETIDVSPDANPDDLLVSDRGFGALYRVSHDGWRR